jgi:hypothetical protein
MRDTLPKPSFTQPTPDPSCEESIPDTLRMMTPEDAARAALREVVGDLSHDEVRVLRPRHASQMSRTRKTGQSPRGRSS